MDELKELFGDGALTAEEFAAKVAEKGYKLADLSGGTYVDKKKFDRLQGDFDRYKAEAESKYAGYEEIVKERDTLRAEKETASLAAKVAAAKVAEPFRKFVLSEVKAKVTDKVTFDKALETYLAENSQYVEKGEPANAPIFRVPSQVAGDKGGSGERTTNAIMNDKLRSVLKK